MPLKIEYNQNKQDLGETLAKNVVAFAIMEDCDESQIFLYLRQTLATQEQTKKFYVSFG